MTIDIAKHLGALTREVSTCERNGRLARVIVATRTYDTDIDDAWDALTNPERIPRWFLPISGDLKLGGRYQLEGNAGGTISTCEPPRHLAVTWEFGGQVSWVTVQLAEDSSGGTRLELEHVAHVDDEWWNQYGPGAVGVGWDLAFMGLGEHLATGAAVDREQAMAWSGSDGGKSFMRQSSHDWCRASIASGTSETDAVAAAKRTTEFYTGESGAPDKGS